MHKTLRSQCPNFAGIGCVDHKSCAHYWKGSESDLLVWTKACWGQRKSLC